MLEYCKGCMTLVGCMVVSVGFIGDLTLFIVDR